MLAALFVAIVLYAGLPLLAVGWWMRRRSGHLDRYHPAGAPICGRCGYLLRGWSTTACPECGADVRRVPTCEEGLGRWHAVRVGLLLVGVLLASGAYWALGWVLLNALDR